MKRVAVAIVLLALVASMACAEEAQEQKYTVGIDADSVDQIAQTLERYVDGPLGVYYEGAVRKNRIVPAVQLIPILLLGLAGGFLLRRGLVIMADESSCEDESPWLAFGSATLLLTLIVCMFWVDNDMPRMISPEYYAIRDILQSLPR